MQEKETQPTQGKSTFGGVVLFLVAAVFMVYWILPNTGVLIDRTVVKGTIEKTHNNALSVSYVNPLDQQTYYLRRKIDSRVEQYLKSRPETIEVAYSRYFPDNATLPAVESDRSVFSVVAILVILTTAFFIVKDDLIKRLL
ncbi:hypothetical protein [Hymenobacter sp. B1770]|uniref:hypothetical protein n=1 Tax=Hymenobacter sp. B1770 TaxID=1718788 RepID=UPI003CEAB0F1